MTAAFDLIRNTLGQPLTAATFIALHDEAVTGVRSHGRQIKKGLGDGTQIYVLDPHRKISKHARVEWSTDRLMYEHKGTLEFDSGVGFRGRSSPRSRIVEHKRYELGQAYDDTADRQRYLALPWVKEKTLHKQRAQDLKDIGEIFVGHDVAIRKATTQKAKLVAIAETCRKLEVGHFFADGNQRTVAVLVLNKLLVENGFRPAVLSDRSVFRGALSARELVKEIKDGMKSFKAERHRKPRSTSPKPASTWSKLVALTRGWKLP